MIGPTDEGRFSLVIEASDEYGTGKFEIPISIKYIVIKEQPALKKEMVSQQANETNEKS